MGAGFFPASCLSVPWDTARCHKVCDFSVTSPVAAFGRGTGYSALSKAKYTRACGAPETRFINHDAVIKKQVFPPPSPHLPPKKRKILQPKEHWLIRMLTTSVASCIILFSFYKCRLNHLANVFRQAPSAWGQPKALALSLPPHSAVDWRLPGWVHLPIAPLEKGGCACFILFSMKILAISQMCYICQWNSANTKLYGF